MNWYDESEIDMWAEQEERQLNALLNELEKRNGNV